MYHNRRDREETNDEPRRFGRFFQGPPLRGVIPIAVLSLIKDKPAHGGEIAQSLQVKFDIESARPVIYILLRRLERFGLVLSSWDIQENGPARRTYTITEDGLDHLNYGLERLRKMRHTINLLAGDELSETQQKTGSQRRPRRRP